MDYPDYESHYSRIVSSLRFPLTIKQPTELKNSNEKIDITEDNLYDWKYPITIINHNLETFISKRHKERTDNDCLLLYSGGKDSTIAAIRLYNVYKSNSNCKRKGI